LATISFSTMILPYRVIYTHTELHMLIYRCRESFKWNE